MRYRPLQLRDENNEIQKKKQNLLDALTQLNGNGDSMAVGSGALIVAPDAPPAGSGGGGGDDDFYMQYGEMIEAKLREVNAAWDENPVCDCVCG